MKKIIALILVFVFAFSCIGVLAEETEGYKTALSTVKERIGDTDKYDEFASHVQSDENGTSYIFSWSNDKEGLSVTITEGGVVVNYDAYTKRHDDSISISERVTKEEAEKRARELFAVINPAISDNIEFVSCDYTNDSFRFGIIRTESGYRVSGNSGTLSIDAKAENIEYFYLNYDESAKFQTGDIISETEARAAFKDKLGFELLYVSEWGVDEREVYLVYEPKNSGNKYISALNGEIIDVTYGEEGYKFANTYAMADSAMEQSMAAGFSEAEISEFEDIELTVSRQKAVDAIRNCKYFNLPDNAFENFSISTYDIDDETRGYNFTFKYDGFYANARVNAETGEILSFRKAESGTDVKFTAEQAEKTADEAFSALAGSLYNEYRQYDNEAYVAVPYREDEVRKTASFSYVRFVNGVPFYDDTVNITVDLSDNSVTSYSIYHSDVDFQPLDGVIDLNEASEIYFEQAGFEPVYVSDKDEYKLVYSLIEPLVSIDAFTGKNTFGHEIKGYTDVSGHYGESIVNSLHGYRIGFNTEELKPDEPVKQKEFIALLNECVKYHGSVMLDDGYNYDHVYEYDVSDIIEDEAQRNPDAVVTRLDAAKFTVCAMGYGDIGKLDVYRPMFTDMEDAGYASILCGLKIMNGDGYGNFNPGSVLTRAQALIIIYNYLDM